MLKLEDGHTYLNRGGNKIKVTLWGNWASEDYPYCGDNGATYTKNGLIWIDGPQTNFDLISEYIPEIKLFVGAKCKTIHGATIKCTEQTEDKMFFFGDGLLRNTNGKHSTAYFVHNVVEILNENERPSQYKVGAYYRDENEGGKDILVCLNTTPQFAYLQSLTSYTYGREDFGDLTKLTDEEVKEFLKEANK